MHSAKTNDDHRLQSDACLFRLIGQKRWEAPLAGLLEFALHVSASTPQRPRVRVSSVALCCMSSAIALPVSCHPSGLSGKDMKRTKEIK